MTPYQRGNRDGLLSIAATFDEKARAWDAEAARIEASMQQDLPRHARNAAARLRHAATAAAFAWTEAAKAARQAAEALPLDPEETSASPKKA